MAERWLVTGALGCIGAWVVRLLADEGAEVTTLDLETDGPRLELIAGRHRLAEVRRLAGDIRDLDAVRKAFAEADPTHVVHLAALQVPFCKADPTLGAQVNVVGTVNVFEVAAGRVQGLTYASSIAAYDAMEVIEPPGGGELPGHPATLYGAYKRANEATAHVYWLDRQLASLGLRPHTVYGPGRDQGLTSQPTAAMKAAATGEAYEIGFGGRLSMQFTEDVASDFIAAARAVTAGTAVVNLGGTVASIGEVVDAIVDAVPEAAGQITFAGEALPFPSEVEVDRTAFQPRARTTLAAGVRATIEHFRAIGTEPAQAGA